MGTGARTLGVLNDFQGNANGSFQYESHSQSHGQAMIPITLSWFVCFYLALFLAGVLILWIGYEIVRKRHANTLARNRVFCRICGSRYNDISSADILHCPVCESLNERSSSKR